MCSFVLFVGMTPTCVVSCLVVGFDFVRQHAQCVVARSISNLEFLAAQRIFINILAAIGCNLPDFRLSSGVSSESVGGSVSGYSVSSPLSDACCFLVRVLSFCVSPQQLPALQHLSMFLCLLGMCGNNQGI